MFLTSVKLYLWLYLVRFWPLLSNCTEGAIVISRDDCVQNSDEKYDGDGCVASWQIKQCTVFLFITKKVTKKMGRHKFKKQQRFYLIFVILDNNNITSHNHHHRSLEWRRVSFLNGRIPTFPTFSYLSLSAHSLSQCCCKPVILNRCSAHPSKFPQTFKLTSTVKPFVHKKVFSFVLVNGTFGAINSHNHSLKIT